MANIIIVSLKEETKAIEALHKIKELDMYGDITLYEHIMIRKKENNHYEVLENDTSDNVWRTLTGAMVGGLIGAFAGPIGLTIGLLTGTTIGVVADVAHYDFEDDFIKKVNNNMKPGTIAIVAEVSEDSPVFLDDYLKPFNAEIVRTEADLEYDDFIDEQIEEFEDKIQDEREKLKKATADEKVKIKARIADLKAQRKAKIAELEAKQKATLASLKNKTKSKIQKLESRVEHYKDNVSNAFAQARKNRLKKRIKKEEEKLYQLHEALGEDIVD